MALLLWAASFLAFLSGTPELGFAIIAVIFINAIFSFLAGISGEKAIEALKKILPSTAKVMRDGVENQILASELVPGDILLLEEGDNISADCPSGGNIPDEGGFPFPHWRVKTCAESS